MNETPYTVMAHWARTQHWDEAVQRDLILAFLDDRMATNLNAFLAMYAAKHRGKLDAGPVELMIPRITLQNLTSYIVNMLLTMDEAARHASRLKEPKEFLCSIVETMVALLRSLSESGAKDFDEWRKCPECGAVWTHEDTPVLIGSGYLLIAACQVCKTEFEIHFRPTGAPEKILPF